MTINCIFCMLVLKGNVMADRRKIRSDREIRKVFLELLKKKKLEHITVAELTREADIGRATFYLHYKDVYDLFEKMELELFFSLKEIFARREDEDISRLLLRRVTETIEYIEDNIDYVRVFFAGKESILRLEQYCSKQFLLEFYPNEKTNYGVVEVDFVAWGFVGVIKNWILGNIVAEKKELINILMHVLARFIPDVII